MGELNIRALDADEYRAAHTLFRAALHMGPAADEQWTYAAQSYEPGRTFGAFVAGAPVGTVNSFSSALTVPGGASLPMAAVTRVGVRADHTRRGVLTSLMRVQLEQAHQRGEVFAGLRASEAVIYGRFGYGVSTLSREIRLDMREAKIRPDLPSEGQVRLIDAETAVETLPKVYERLGGYRPGVMKRAEQWWKVVLERAVRTGEYWVFAVHSGKDGDDGFVTYAPRQRESFSAHPARSSLEVDDFHAANPAAVNGLWRFLLGVDFVDEIKVWARPTDEPVEELLVDRRACRTVNVDDDLSLRIIDVPAALAARVYGDAGAVVVEVSDKFLPRNSGRYRISPDGAAPTTEPAQLAMDVDVLASVYLGTIRPSVLAGAGKVTVHDPAGPARADRLFATDSVAFCGTGF